MSAVAAALPLIKQFEGCRLEAYLDVAGYPTQGYGHLLTLDQAIPLGRFPRITQPLAEQWLAEDLQKTLVGVEAALDGHGPFTDNELAAMCSLAFNIGIAAFTGSTVCRRLVTADPPDRDGAANAFLLWNKITVNGRKEMNQGLANRRAAERALFLKRE